MNLDGSYEAWQMHGSMPAPCASNCCVQTIGTCDYTDSDGGTWQAHRQILNEFGMFDDIIAQGAAQAHGASVCLLYSETDDVWFNGLEYGPAQGC